MYKKNILLVEDNPNDELLTLRAFKKCNICSTFTIAHDGEEALSVLEGEYSQITPPDLILLDLNLPKVSGFEVLKKLKESNNLKHLPVVVLTTSKAHDDINKCYDYGANSYMSKPIDFKEFTLAIEELGNFWLKKNITINSIKHQNDS